MDDTMGRRRRRGGKGQGGLLASLDAVALKQGHGACAALLNLAAPELMVWSSPLKFIGELEADARAASRRSFST
jgi:hypothetical protein